MNYRPCPIPKRPWNRTLTRSRWKSITTAITRLTWTISTKPSPATLRWRPNHWRRSSATSRPCRTTSAARCATTAAAIGTIRSSGRFSRPRPAARRPASSATPSKHVRLVRRFSGEVRGGGHRAFRQRLGMARLQRREAGNRFHRQPGQSAHGQGHLRRRRQAVSRRGCLGARVLPEIPEQARGLSQGGVERD